MRKITSLHIAVAACGRCIVEASHLCARASVDAAPQLRCLGPCHRSRTSRFDFSWLPVAHLPMYQGGYSSLSVDIERKFSKVFWNCIEFLNTSVIRPFGVHKLRGKEVGDHPFDKLSKSLDFANLHIQEERRQVNRWYGVINVK